MSGAQDLSYPPDSVMLMINSSYKALTLPKAATLGVTQEISEDLVVLVMNVLMNMRSNLFIREIMKG
jgi:hypothetical protein